MKKGGFQNRSEWSSPRFSYSENDYGRLKATHKPSYLSTAAPAKPAAGMLELNKGDMVEHTAFGTGLVLSVVKMGGDALLEIAFDKIGTRKLMAKTASAHMKKL